MKTRHTAPRFLTVREVAELLRESPSGLYTQIRDGRFPHTRVGGRIVVERDELERYLEANSVTPENLAAIS